ncbi:MAG: MraY family glycosyltransferase [Candidatus Saccharibacteria bacterium]
MNYIFALVASFLIAVLLVPWVKKLSFAVGAIDRPEKNSRKIHKKTMARGGGLAIFAAFVIVTFFLVPERNLQYWGLLFASSIVLIIGFIDDINSLNPWIKLSAQVFAALCAFSFFGIKIEAVTNPIGQSFIFVDPNIVFSIYNHQIGINIIALLITTIWLVGMTNTMNFVDGIDGLSGGIAAIAAAIMFFLSLSPTVHQAQTAIISISLLGGCLGYLVYNFYPAKIFNGDSGAYFLGMSLGIIAIFSGAKLATAALVLGVPILDAIWAAVRRILSGRSPFSADRGHLHFLLLDVGFTQRQTALIIYSLCIVFGVIALIASPTQKILAIFALVIIIILLLTVLTLTKRRKAQSS